MKTSHYLLALLFFGVSLHSNGQFSIGIKGSYGKAWENYGNAPVPENAVIHVPAYQIAGLVNVKLSKFLSIGIEPGYVRRGAACIPEFVTFDSDRKFMLNYAEVPLVLTGSIPVFDKKFELFGKAGYGISYMIKGSQVFIDLTGANDPEVVPFDFKNPFGINVSRWDNGIYGGLGLAYHVSFGLVFFESNYYMGMRNISYNSTSKSRNLQIGLGYLVSL